MYLVAGLGNPGDDYAYTWHNCGFLALEMLADKNKIVLNKSKFKGVYGQGRIGGEQVILVKPQTCALPISDIHEQFRRVYRSSCTIL